MASAIGGWDKEAGKVSKAVGSMQSFEAFGGKTGLRIGVMYGCLSFSLTGLTAPAMESRPGGPAAVDWGLGYSQRNDALIPTLNCLRKNDPWTINQSLHFSILSQASLPPASVVLLIDN